MLKDGGNSRESRKRSRLRLLCLVFLLLSFRPSFRSPLHSSFRTRAFRKARVRKSEYVDILLDSMYDVNICPLGQIGSINFWTVRALFGSSTKSRKSLRSCPDSPIIARLYFPCYPFIGISTRATRDRDTRDTHQRYALGLISIMRTTLCSLSLSFSLSLYCLPRNPENKIVRLGQNRGANPFADGQRRHRASYRARAIVSLISGIINVFGKRFEIRLSFILSLPSPSVADRFLRHSVSFRPSCRLRISPRFESNRIE